MAQVSLPAAADFAHIAPLLVTGAMAFIVLLWDVLLKPRSKTSLIVLSLSGLTVAMALSVQTWMDVGEQGQSLFSGRILVDRFAMFFHLLVLGVGFLVTLISREYLEREEIHVGEYYALLYFALFGMLLLTLASDLVLMFIGIEVMSISMYVMAAFNRSQYRCIEGALKYFIMGAFASAFLLYGIALLYGHTGSTLLSALESQAQVNVGSPLLLMGMGLLLVGFGFKVGAVPFHMWAPDVYEGAPTPVTAAMATAVKAAAFAAFIRTLVALSSVAYLTEKALWLLAAVTIVWGNVAAIRQSNVKRMLAYSGIAHSGYLLAGLLAIRSGTGLSAELISGLAFYLVAYVFTNIGAFALLIMIGRKEEEPVEAEDWAGLGFRYPWMGAAMTLFLLSLGGLPPTAGFFAKFYLFRSIVEAGYTYLVIIAVLASAASFYYYLRIVVQMYMFPDTQRWSPRWSQLGIATVAVTVLATTLLGILPSGPLSVLQWARGAGLALY